MPDDSRSFLGSGWVFPILPDDQGRLGYVANEPNVDQSIELLLRTACGERVMRADFGTTAAEVLFETDTDHELHRLETIMTEAIQRFEPRVDVVGVRATRRPANATTVAVAVDYRILATNTRRSSVYPFYLDQLGPQP